MRILAILPGSAVKILKLCRDFFLYIIEPIDYFVRLINGKKDFPPLYLRRYVGPLRGFESSGAEFLAYLKLICKLQPTEKILDIGSGCGLMALYLKEYLNLQGQYTGVDIHLPSIKWCQRKMRNKNYDFMHIDVKNSAYNPKGKYDSSNFNFPFKDSSFDVILIKSVFTHILPSDLDNYLKEVARMLSNNGRCLTTFFLLNEEQNVLSAKKLNKLNFMFGNSIYKYVYKNSPESAVAYNENYVMEICSKYNLIIEKIYGNWAGRENGISFQDIMIIRK